MFHRKGDHRSDGGHAENAADRPVRRVARAVREELLDGGELVEELRARPTHLLPVRHLQDHLETANFRSVRVW